jgi:hypothetical protein
VALCHGPFKKLLEKLMTDSVHETSIEANTANAESCIEPYRPPISAIATNPAKLIERQREAEQREMEAVLSAPPSTAIPGTGPEISIGIDAEWVHDPINCTNRILSIQFHLVGECGEFSHIEYLEVAHEQPS